MALQIGSTDELSTRANMRAIAAEFIATFLFIFLGAGSVVSLGFIADGDVAATVVGIAIAHGLAIALLVTATANISGGHINPAVTFAAVLTGRMSVYLGGAYVVAQLVGAVVGAFLLKIVIDSPFEGNLGAHALGPGVDGEAAGLLVEIFLTFALVFVVFASAMDPRGRGALAPIAIGFIFLVDSLVGIPLTGASMNPARSFGPSLVANFWEDHWIYWLGPLIGGAIAGFVYHYVFLPTEEPTHEPGREPM